MPVYIAEKSSFIESQKDANKILCPVIYGLASKDSLKVVYIGKTLNFGKRFNAYKHYCHNKALKVWMAKNKWGIVLLDIDPYNVDTSEKAWIKKYQTSLFNLVGGGEQSWRHHDREAWMAGQNIKCPSDVVLTWLRNRRLETYPETRDIVNARRRNMTRFERVSFEVSLAMDFYDLGQGAMRDLFEKWLSYTEARIITCLEAG